MQVLISTGCTGGHLFPAVSFAQSFKKTHPEVKLHLLLSRLPDFAKDLTQLDAFQIHVIQMLPRPKIFSFRMFSFLLRYAVVYIETGFLLFKLKPVLVIGFGSYASVPSIFGSFIMGIPTLLHEQNRMAGKANRWLSYGARKIAVSFPETYGIGSKHKIVFTGFPLRSDFLALMKDHQAADNSAFKILVFGGSQGSRRLNEIFLQAIKRFDAEELKQLAVKHIVGSEDLDRIQGAYHEQQLTAEVSSFSYNIAKDYRSADLIISRSGAGTVFELIEAAKPAILVPYPHASFHQKMNAEYLSKQGAAILVLEENLTADLLVGMIRDLKRNAQKRLALTNRLKTLSQPDAVGRLVDLTWELMCKNN